VVVAWSERTIVCMAHRSDITVEWITRKIGTANFSITEHYSGIVEWPLLCECVDPGDYTDPAILKIYRGEWPLELKSINQGCYIEGNRCRACYSIRTPEGPSLITFDPGVVFALEQRRVLAVESENVDTAEVREMKTNYISTVTLNLRSVEKLLSTYSDIYLGNQLRHFMDRITEGGLLLRPEVARAIRRGPLVTNGTFILEKMTFYTCLQPTAVQSLLLSVEEIEGILTSPTMLNPSSSGSGTEGRFNWTVYGLGPYALRRREAHHCSFTSIYHHGRVMQQWINSKVRPLSELFTQMQSVG